MNRTTEKFILKNFIKMVFLLFAVSIVAFALMTASPIDPLKANVGQAALGSMSQDQIAKLVLGRRSAAGAALSCMVQRFCKGRYGNISPLSSEGNNSDCG